MTEVADFLEAFFAPPNTIERESPTVESAAARWLRPWIERLEAEPPQPTVLPCRRTGESDWVDWYAVAFNEREGRELAEELAAFLGPSFSTFTGSRADLDPADPIEAAVATLTEGNAFRLRVLTTEDERERVRAQFEALRLTWEQRPSRTRTIGRPVGRVLRDFGVALLARDETASQDYLDEVQRLGYLGADNLAFLKIQRLAALERYREIFALDEFQTVLAAARPRAVTQDLIRAAYNVHLRAFEDIGQPAQALKAMRDTVLARYPGLFRAWSGMPAPEALKSFMLLAVLPENPDPGLRDQLLASDRVTAVDRPYLTQIAALSQVKVPPPTDRLRDAREALDRERYDHARELIDGAEHGPRRTELLIECALLLDSEAAANDALAALDQLSVESAQALTDSPVHGALLERTLVLASAGSATEARDTPTDWTDLLSRLDDLTPARARALAKSSETEWSLTELRSDTEHVERLAQLLLAERSEAESELLRDLLPDLLAFLEPARDDRGLRQLWLAIAQALALSPGLGPSHLALIVELHGRLLRLGLSQTDYEQLVSDFRDVWRDWGSAQTLDALLDMADILLDHQTAMRSGAAAILEDGLVVVGEHPARIADYQLAVMGGMCDEGGLRPDFDAVAQRVQEVRAGDDEQAGSGFDAHEAAARALDGTRIGIYTLTPSAGKRAKQTLEAEFPGVSVEVRGDTHASQALEALARASEIFVIVWRSATHAATEAIEAHRPKDRPILRPQGTGASGIVRAVHAHVGLA